MISAIMFFPSSAEAIDKITYLIETVSKRVDAIFALEASLSTFKRDVAARRLNQATRELFAQAKSA